VPVSARAEEKSAGFMGPQGEAAERAAGQRPELPPYRLGVAPPPEIAPDRRRAPRRLVVQQLIMRATRRKRGGDILRGHHAGHHGIVAALDARHVHEAGGATDERAAREDKLRHRLPAAFGKRAGAVANALAADEGAAHKRMGLEALKLLERRDVGIVVVEMNDKADRHQMVAEVIEERTAADTIAERPTHGVLN